MKAVRRWCWGEERSWAAGQAATGFAFEASAGRSTAVRGEKDQPLPANVWAITVSISEKSKHRRLLGIEENWES